MYSGCFPGKTSPLFLLILLASYSYASTTESQDEPLPVISKVKDIVIYEDPKYYSAFPSVIKRPDGELIAAFRRAPSRRAFGEEGYTHTDPNSYLVLVRSHDGITWTKEPEMIYAHAFGGSQDPCLLQLRDKSLLCSSYGWAMVKPDGIENLKKPYYMSGGFVFLGGYLLRSGNGGKTWDGPCYPPRIPPETGFNALGEPLPAYNRGAMCEARNGRIYWVVACSDSASHRRSETHLIVSDDKGFTWSYLCPVAKDDSASFNETSLYETPGGDLVAFLRTANLGDQACIARSTDGGKSFEPWQKMDFQGHPLNALQLPDKRVLLVYGYRHEPYGIRARILNPECTDFETAQEIILLDAGESTDIGYPWPVMLDKKHILVTYYFNISNGTRHIAGTILEIK